jgi:hypothetical protein
MRFQEYLYEEYFTRKFDAEIFKNPDRKETRDLYNKYKNMRLLVDFNNKTVFIFTFELLHNMAAEQLAKEEIKGEFDSFEIISSLDGKSLELISEHRLFKIVDGKVSKINKETSKSNIEWIKNYFKFLGKIEDYKPGSW